MNRYRDSQRGAVIVMVAIWLPVLALFASFAIDAGHWWDYSRNLQNRADAAALAGGDQLAICLGSPSSTDEAGIGKIAQQYSGPPTNTPDSLANVPYLSADMVGFTPPYNVPNLTSGSGPEGPDFHLLLNSSQYWPAVSQNGANGYGDMGSYCNASDPSADPSDPNACTPTSTCSIVDARITQANVPMFFGLLGFHPNITAHARTQLKIVGGLNNSIPVGVGDAGESSCMAARLVDETKQNGQNNGGVLAEWSLTQPDPVNDPTTWSGAMPSSLSIPTSNGTPDQLSIQAMIPANCSDPFGNDGGLIWDITQQNVNQGVVFINTYKPLNPPVSSPTRGSVWLEARSCLDPYFNSFKSGTCTVRLHAQVDFPPGSSGVATVSEDGSATYSPMTPDGTDAAGNQYWYADFTIPAESGRHTFSLGWSGAGTGHFNGGDAVQATFAGFDDGTGQDDSGPVIQAQVGCVSGSGCPSIGNPPMTTDGAAGGVDSIPGSGTGSTPTLQVTFKLQGLAQSGPQDKASVLRSSVSSSTSHRTGIFDCGAGVSAQDFINVATGGGCGTYPGTSGLTTYQGSLTDWTSGQWPYCIVLPADPISCARPSSGNMRGPVHDTIATLVCGDKNCNSTPPGGACDYWQPYKAGTGVLPNDKNYPNDPRAIPMVVTSPQDLALQENDPRWIRVLGFAIFYVTGWDNDPYIPGPGSKAIPGCDPVGGTATNVDEPYPYGTAPNNAVWGHFIGYVIPGENPSEKNCVKGSALLCTPALTR